VLLEVPSTTMAPPFFADGQRRGLASVVSTIGRGGTLRCLCAVLANSFCIRQLGDDNGGKRTCLQWSPTGRAVRIAARSARWEGENGHDPSPERGPPQPKDRTHRQDSGKGLHEGHTTSETEDVKDRAAACSKSSPEDMADRANAKRCAAAPRTEPHDSSRSAQKAPPDRSTPRRPGPRIAQHGCVHGWPPPCTHPARSRRRPTRRKRSNVARLDGWFGPPTTSTRSPQPCRIPAGREKRVRPDPESRSWPAGWRMVADTPCGAIAPVPPRRHEGIGEEGTDREGFDCGLLHEPPYQCNKGGATSV
jgi:hypothetical protein